MYFELVVRQRRNTKLKKNSSSSQEDKRSTWLKFANESRRVGESVSQRKIVKFRRGVEGEQSVFELRDERE